MCCIVFFMCIYFFSFYINKRYMCLYNCLFVDSDISREKFLCSKSIKYNKNMDFYYILFCFS